MKSLKRLLLNKKQLIKEFYLKHFVYEKIKNEMFCDKKMNISRKYFINCCFINCSGNIKESYFKNGCAYHPNFTFGNGKLGNFTYNIN